MLYWIHWNQKIEEIAKERFCFEDILHNPKPLFDYLNIKLVNRIDGTNKIAASGKKSSVTWKQLESIDDQLYRQIRILAKKYGYKT